MKKLLFITNQFMTGGVERVFINISRLLKKEIYLLPVHQNLNSELISSLPSNVTVIRHPYKTASSLGLILSFFKIKQYLHTVVDTKDCVVINFSDTITTLFFTLILNSKEKISWVHCNPEAYRESKFFRFYQVFFTKMSKIVCLCEMQKKCFLETFDKCLESNITICNNYTDIIEIDKKMNEKLDINYPFFVMVARIDFRSKDFFTVVDAFGQIVDENKDLKLLFVGNGDDREKLQKYINNKNLSDRILLCGNQNNPYKYMTKSNAVILSSRSEGYSMVVAEALACNSMVISSDCYCGPREILDNGKYGDLFPIGDIKSLSSIMRTKIRKENNTQGRKRIIEMNENIKNQLRSIFGE